MNLQKPVLAVGSIALDSIETSKGSCFDILGGSASYFTLAASLFTEVRVVGIVGSDFPDQGHALFNRKNINNDNLKIDEGKTFRWGGRYSSDYSERDTLFTELGVFETFMPDINSKHRDTPFLFLGNIHPQLQLHVLDQVNKSSIVITDTMNLWIDTAIKDLNKVIQRSNIFLLNDEEATQLTGYSDLNSAGKSLLKKGPEIVIIKKGAKGSLIFENNDCTYVPVFPDVSVKDPTGAGDSFAGGLIGMLCMGKNIFDSVITASSVASITVSHFGLEGLKSLTLKEIKLRSKKINSILSESNLLV